jgi:hypothetical protein
MISFIDGLREYFERAAESKPYLAAVPHRYGSRKL